MVTSVRLIQYGGHLGSFAGDCALVVIEDDRGGRHGVIIDTGDSTAWAEGAPNARSGSTLERTPQSLKDAVNEEVGRGARVTLVTTHFHKDHFNPAMLVGVMVGEHIFPDLPGAAPYVEAHVPLAPGYHERVIGGLSLSFYVPPAGKPADLNDNCMAVHFSHNQLPYVGFGDMTKDAYLRNRHPIPHPAGADVRWVKYPHHGSPANYLRYFEGSIGDAEGVNILISGNTGADVTDTIGRLLIDWENVSDVYCLARTCEAKDAFNINRDQLSNSSQIRPLLNKLHLCSDIRLDSSGMVEMVGEVEWNKTKAEKARAAQSDARAERQKKRRGEQADDV